REEPARLMIQPRLAWELARKDLLLFAADRRGMLLCFGVPILLASAFGAIFHRPEEARIRPRAFVVSQDNSPLGRRIVHAQGARELLAPLLAKGAAADLGRPFTVERRAEPAGGALSVNAFSHSFCGMSLQYLLFWGVDSGLLLLRERRLGIWRRLRAAPVSRL